MDDRPTIGDLVACAAVAAISGGGLVGIVAGSLALVDNLALRNIPLIPAAMGIGMLVAVFTAWPIGIVTGLIISRTLGWGYPTAALAGGLTALALIFIAGLQLIAPWPDFLPALLLIPYGMALGAIGWRLVIHPGGLRYQA